MSIETGPGAHPASCTTGIGSSMGVKRPGLGVDHPPTSIAEVKERVELTSTPTHGLPGSFQGNLTVPYLLTYLLTPWCTVLLEKLTGSQPFKKFPTFYGTRRFITASTSVRHLFLS